MTTLKQLFDEAEAALGYPLTEEARMRCVQKWLQQKEKEMFIETVSLMDCELSAVRTKTFEELLKDLET